jgi:hypothetical protein
MLLSKNTVSSPFTVPAVFIRLVILYNKMIFNDKKNRDHAKQRDRLTYHLIWGKNCDSLQTNLQLSRKRKETNFPAFPNTKERASHKDSLSIITYLLIQAQLG